MSGSSNKVTLTFAGDTTSLDRANKDVQKSTQDTAQAFTDSSGKIANAGRGTKEVFAGLGNAAQLFGLNLPVNQMADAAGALGQLGRGAKEIAESFEGGVAKAFAEFKASLGFSSVAVDENTVSLDENSAALAANGEAADANAASHAADAAAISGSSFGVGGLLVGVVATTVALGAFTSWLDQAGDSSTKLLSPLDQLTTSLSGVKDQAGALSSIQTNSTPAAKGWIDQFQKGGVSVTQLNNAMAAFATIPQDVSQKLSGMAASTAQANAEINALPPSAKQAALTLESYGYTAQVADQAAKDFSSASQVQQLNNAAGAAAAAAAQLERYNADLDAQARSASGINTPFDDGIQELYNDGLTTGDPILDANTSAASKAATGAITGATGGGGGGGSSAAAKTINTYSKSLGKSFIDGLVDGWSSVPASIDATFEKLNKTLQNKLTNLAARISDAHQIASSIAQAFAPVLSTDSTASVLDNLGKQLDQTQALQRDLALLAKEGLSKDLLQQLAAGGAASLAAADQLANGGQGAVSQANSYAAGIAAAGGSIAGAEAQRETNVQLSANLTSTLKVDGQTLADITQKYLLKKKKTSGSLGLS